MDSDVFKSLEARVTRIVSAGSAGFDAARDLAIWNKRLARARSPVAIVTVRTAEEAAETIRFAIRNGLTVSPRGGGHNYQASALRDGSILLDLGGLDTVEIDAAAGTARVGVGVEGGALSERLAQAGFAFPVGHCVDVALSGYLIGGGFGWNAGEWSAACANVEAIEMIRADGQIVIANPEEHADSALGGARRGTGFLRCSHRFPP